MTTRAYYVLAKIQVKPIHGVPEWGSSRKISNGLDLTVVLSRFKNYRQVLELRSWEFSCVGFAFRRCGKFQNVERDRKNLKCDLVKGLKKNLATFQTTWHTAKPFDPPVLETPPTLDLHCLIRRAHSRTLFDTFRIRIFRTFSSFHRVPGFILHLGNLCPTRKY